MSDATFMCRCESVEKIHQNAKPILFNTEMTKAILENRKTVTRRVVKPQPEKSAHSPYECCGGRWAFRVGERGCTEQYRPPCFPGSILYMRETWTKLYYVDPDGYSHYDQQMYYYAADGTLDITLFDDDGFELDDQRIKWRPSIHMPREVARIFLRVTDVRVERLQDMNMNDVQAEGVVPNGVKGGQWQQWQRDYMKPVWDSTIKPNDRALYGWDANPWVWVIGFERISKEEAER